MYGYMCVSVSMVISHEGPCRHEIMSPACVVLLSRWTFALWVWGAREPGQLSGLPLRSHRGAGSHAREWGWQRLPQEGPSSHLIPLKKGFARFGHPCPCQQPCAIPMVRMQEEGSQGGAGWEARAVSSSPDQRDLSQ